MLLTFLGVVGSIAVAMAKAENLVLGYVILPGIIPPDLWNAGGFTRNIRP